VLAVWGDNLFKMAPIIGHDVASAAEAISYPPQLAAVRHA